MTRRPNFVIFSEQASSRDKKKGGTFFERVPPFSVFMSGIFCGIECFYLGNTVLRGLQGTLGTGILGKEIARPIRDKTRGGRIGTPLPFFYPAESVDIRDRVPVIGLP
ncbi:hypothetical protein, partial [Bilophila wadsworthia]